MNKKGQLSLINIMFFIMLVFVAGIGAAILDDFIEEQVIAHNTTGVQALLMNNITTFLWLGVVITFFLYVTPIRPQQY
jgi:hypothetical protein